MYRIFGWWYRWQACKMAALAIQNHTDKDEIAPRVWSLTVFFEKYMCEGAEGTAADFGPKKPVQLEIVNERTQ